MSETKFQLPGMALIDHFFDLPLDYQNPNGEQITVYAREVRALGKENENHPWLLFLQGGPGGSSPRPSAKEGWIKKALEKYRVLLLDQRGVGRSTPATFESLARFSTSKEQADYLKNFRADTIVQDCERIRWALSESDEPWSILGQSFGGFCAVHYLSVAAHGLKEVYITGGLPSLERSAEDVYRMTYQRVLDQNKKYYERYPQDVVKIQEIVQYLQTHDVQLPGGGKLTVRRFQQLGLQFGFSGGFETVHYAIEDAFIQTPQGKTLSYNFLRNMENISNFDSALFYSILHEACYCQKEASNWSAERIRDEFSEFEVMPDRPVYFTGEMIFSWMFDDCRNLRPLKEAAEILASYDGWPRLYDLEALKMNKVPVVAAIYSEDMYVERYFSEETAKAISGVKVWLTNEYQHNALRANGEIVLGRLMDMMQGEI